MNSLISYRLTIKTLCHRRKARILWRFGYISDKNEAHIIFCQFITYDMEMTKKEQKDEQVKQYMISINLLPIDIR